MIDKGKALNHVGYASYIPSGDIAKCNEWEPWAQNYLMSMHKGSLLAQTRVIRPVDNVEITLMTFPNRIFIRADGGLIIYIPDRDYPYIPQPPAYGDGTVPPPLYIPPLDEGDIWIHRERGIYFEKQTEPKKLNVFSMGADSDSNFAADTSLPLKKYWVSKDKRQVLQWGEFFDIVSLQSDTFFIRNNKVIEGLFIENNNHVYAASYVDGIYRIIFRRQDGHGADYYITAYEKHPVLDVYIRIYPETYIFTIIAYSLSDPFAAHTMSSFTGDGDVFLLQTPFERTFIESLSSLSRNTIRKVTLGITRLEGGGFDFNLAVNLLYSVTFNGTLTSYTHFPYVGSLFEHNHVYFQQSHTVVSGGITDPSSSILYLHEYVPPGIIVDIGIDNADMNALITYVGSGVGKYIFANVEEDIFACILVLDAFDPIQSGNLYKQQQDVIVKYKGEIILSTDLTMEGVEVISSALNNVNVDGNFFDPRTAYNGDVFVVSLGWYTLVIGMKPNPDNTPNIRKFYRLDYGFNDEVGYYTRMPITVANL